MADPRFYDNRGPFTLAAICAVVNVAVPDDANGGAAVADVAGLAQAGPSHLSFFAARRTRNDLLDTKAGWCLVGQDEESLPPKATVPLRVASVPHAFAAIARQFYPESELALSAQEERIHPSAQIGDGAVLGPGVIVGPGAEIGRGTSVGGNAVIGRGVAIGRNCEIGSNVGIAFAYLGDEVVVQSGARIGGSGFGFASGPAGHLKIPQLGRVIVQDRVEIGANSTIDRGALIDTVLGEGSKIDNLVQIGHNSRIGRHCVIVGHTGVSGSVTIGDFAIIGGMVGIADHVTIGDGARVGGLAGVTRNLPGGHDYGGHPARTLRDWLRETATLAKLTKARRYSGDG